MKITNVELFVLKADGLYDNPEGAEVNFSEIFDLDRQFRFRIFRFRNYLDCGMVIAEFSLFTYNFYLK